MPCTLCVPCLDFSTIDFDIFFFIIIYKLIQFKHFAGKRAQTLTNATAQQQLHQQQQQLVPPVEILPSQSAQQPTELSIAATAPLAVAPPTAAPVPVPVVAPPASASASVAAVASTPNLVSPVESPRRSIILQPPMADALQQAPSFVFAQVSQIESSHCLTN